MNAAGSGGSSAGRGGDGGGGSGGGGRDAGGSDAGARDAGAAASCHACTAYGAPALRGHVGAAGLDALSGAAFSARNPGVLYAHNDHNRPVVYALDDAGEEITRIALAGAPSTDIEDMAVGACPAGSCVYLADIGDNAAVRGEYAILRFAEPRIEPGASESPDVDFERFAFTYEDGSHNAESLLVPPSGDLYIVTKLAAGNASSVYKLAQPLAASGNVAVKVADLPVPKPGDDLLCSGDAHPCGLGFIVRTYNTVYEFRIAEGEPFESAFAVAPTEIAGADEPQSEAIAYLPDGSGFVTSGEGAAAPIYQTSCAP
jgi:hypothetical protein